ncbi:hypothetical protein L218DRAFT_933758, partial [Marasmius fiardii PR-910]
MEGAKRQESLLSEKIARLQSTTASLIEERARIREEIRNYRWILRPVHRLPPELLRRIFSFTLDSSPADDDVFQTPSSLHPTSMPWVLAHICKSWRKFALGTPGLWNLVSLALPSGEASQTFLEAQIHRLSL